jgi:arsenate reductase-like glutaredoxin family protein
MILNDNLSWTFGKGLKPYRWPESKDIKKVFSLLNDSDIPVLITIILKKKVGEAELVSAKWVLSMFTEKARPLVIQRINSTSTPSEQSDLKEILELIEVRKIEKSKP